MNEEIIKEFTSQAIHRIDENTPKLIACVKDLGDADIWKRPNQHSNSVGNIILHLCGNIRQYAISSLGNSKDVRERDKEFSVFQHVAENAKSCLQKQKTPRTTGRCAKLK